MKRKRDSETDNSNILNELSEMTLDKNKKLKKDKKKIHLSTLDHIIINDLSLNELEQYRKVLKKKIIKYSDHLERIENILNLYV